VFRPERVGRAEVTAELRGLAGPGKGGADAWVVIAFGQKLPAALLEGVFAVNLHASLLPRWRGAAPINAAILAGDAVTGNSVITLADRMDAGLVLGQSQRAIGPQMTAGELHDLLAADGPALVERVLSEHAGGTLRPLAQDEALVTIATKLSKESGEIDFHQPADFLRRQVHAMTPWPGATVSFQGKPLKLLRVEEVAAQDAAGAVESGAVVDVERGVVGCGGATALRLLEVQPAGKRPMSWADFARGRRIERGDMMRPAGE
jgi:methionyl-tRNA formyltransferase